MVPVAQFGKTWAVTFRFKPFPVAQRQRERETETETETEKEREGEREGLGDMSTTSLPEAGTKGGTVPPLGWMGARLEFWDKTERLKSLPCLEGEVQVQKRDLVRGLMGREGKGRRAPWPMWLGLGKAALAVGS